MQPRKLELLAPAKNLATGRIAILAGADAVYIGAPAFGARAAATNSIEDIRQLAEFAHRYRARVYVTLNTIVYDDELDEARKIVWDLYDAGVDALIVQDMAYLMMDLPPVALHASTQCDIRTPEKAAWLAKAGFSQLVLPRELTLEEIRKTAKAAGVPVEVFVHGALCVCYSGDCQAGCVAMGRSANRGVCPQMCRLPYELVDCGGNRVAPSKHYLSLRDLNQSSNLTDLIEAGASSFKIEGRLKDERYVANVTAEYSRLLNEIVSASNGKLERSSVGKSVCGFTPDLSRTFNRGYTTYFLKGRGNNLASIDTPKWIGNPVGTVKSVQDGRAYRLSADLSTDLANGDGLAYFDSKGNFHGFRLNKIEGQYLFPAARLEAIGPGTKLYRNFDKNFLEMLDGDNAGCRRTIGVDIKLSRISGNEISINASDERGVEAIVSLDYEYQQSNSPQEIQRRKVFSKMGGTLYRLEILADNLGDIFLPASLLTDARRRILESLDANAVSSYTRESRKQSTLREDSFAGMLLTYHDNVSNSLSKKFYESHGAVVAQRAIEVERIQGETVVMSTRYCIRKELGACLKSTKASALPTPLFLRNESGLYRLDFDCAKCGMKVVKCK